MKYKPLLCMAMLLTVLIFPASASMVSFLVVEAGLNEGAPTTQYGTIWEDGLMSSFFEAGLIVTNSPILRVSEKPEATLTGAARVDFYEAVQGGAEYFILCIIGYEFQGRRMVPVEITIKTYRTDTQERLFEQRFPVGRGRSRGEEIRNAQTAGRIVISQIRGQ